jgi:serine phosphatase RsbU (regulator of sigma subunit)
VSGDFYWYSFVNECSIIATVDCTGHGVPGAFMSMIGNTLLNEIVDEQKITQPDKILSLMHYHVFQSLKQSKHETQDGMDIAICCIDHKNNVLRYSGASIHLYMVQNGEFSFLKSDFESIGGAPLHRGKQNTKKSELKFKLYEVPIKKGLTIYLQSDGFMDQFGEDDDSKFNRGRFKDMVLSINKLDMKAQKKVINDTFFKWKGKVKQVDDVLVIGIRF